VTYGSPPYLARRQPGWQQRRRDFVRASFLKPALDGQTESCSRQYAIPYTFNLKSVPRVGLLEKDRIKDLAPNYKTFGPLLRYHGYGLGCSTRTGNRTVSILNGASLVFSIGCLGTLLGVPPITPTVGRSARSGRRSVVNPRQERARRSARCQRAKCTSSPPSRIGRF
jgi:hypothetical protein